MKKTAALCIAWLMMASPVWGQQWQTIISAENRIGYSSNVYLNPYISEWEATPASMYNLTNIVARVRGYKGRTSLSVTGSGHYQAMLNTNADNWNGVMSWVNVSHQIAEEFTIGLNGGGSFLNGPFNRTVSWLQPSVTWFASPMTLVRAKIGSNYLSYSGQSDFNRHDSYALEVQSWLNYRWQITAGLYSDLQQFPALNEGFNGLLSARYQFDDNSSLRGFLGVQQYQYDLSVDGGNAGSTLQTNTDQMMRYGVQAQRPLNYRLTAFASTEMLHYISDVAGAGQSDIRLSVGIRYSFEPRLGNRKIIIRPRWEMNEREQIVRLHYSGEGRLYLVGSFNGWEKPGIPLREQDHQWYAAELSLNVGLHEYRILRIQGSKEKWLEFSDQIYTVSDDFDGENAVIVVED